MRNEPKGIKTNPELEKRRKVQRGREIEREIEREREKSERERLRERKSFVIFVFM